MQIENSGRGNARDEPCFFGRVPQGSKIGLEARQRASSHQLFSDPVRSKNKYL